MFCPRCGKQIAEGAAFCDNCGISLLPPSSQPSLPSAQTLYDDRQYAGYPQLSPGGRRRGLVIGLIIAGVVVAAAIVVVMLMTGGSSISGLWYSDERGEVLEVKDDNCLYVYTHDDRQKGEYTYDSAKDKGVLNIEGEMHDFIAGKDKLDIEGIGEFERADKRFDIDDFFDDIASRATPKPTPSPTAQPTPEPLPTAETAINVNMTLSFSFGPVSGKYTGETVDGLPDGYGTFTSADFDDGGWSYEGDWVAGHMSGQGYTSWGGGYYQTGEYSNDYLSGHGREYWSDILYYEGEFTEGLFHGQGTIYNIHGEIIYSGSWVYGFIQESSEERSVRVGAFKDECVSVTCEEMYEACKNEEGIRIKTEGIIFDVIQYEGQDYYCDFLMYEQGVEDKGRIIQVYYQLSEGESPLTVGQTVTVWGTTEYLYSYLAESNEYLTVPLIEAWSVE